MRKLQMEILAKAGIGLFCMMAFTMLAVNAVEAAEYKEMESCYTLPTERENGAVLDISEIKSIEINYDYQGDGILSVWNWSVTDTSVNCVKFTPTKANEVCFKGFTIDTNDLESSMSNMVCKMPELVPVLPDTPPKPPSMVAIKLAELMSLLEELIVLVDAELSDTAS